MRPSGFGQVVQNTTVVAIFMLCFECAHWGWCGSWLGIWHAWALAMASFAALAVCFAFYELRKDQR